MKVIAAIPVYNEEAILKNCLDHYSSFCDHIVVWDNGSTDGSTRIAKSYPKVEVRSFLTDGYNEMSVLRVLTDSKYEAVGKYDWIVLPDADEIVALRDGGDLRTFLESSSAYDYLCATGYCFIQAPEEPAIDLERPFIKQRRFGYNCLAYNKPIILKTDSPASLIPGKHQVREFAKCSSLVADNLVLLHYEMVDWALYLYRKNRRPLSKENIEKGLCVQRFCRPQEVIRSHWETAFSKASDLTDILPVIR